MGALNFIAWAFLIVFVIAPIAFFAIALLCQLVYNLVGMVLMILCTILRGILGMFGVACPEPLSTVKRLMAAACTCSILCHRVSMR